MDSPSISETRANLKAVMDGVAVDRVPVTIRRRGENIVMVSQSEWEAMGETLYLMKSPRNAQRLLEAIEGLEKNLFDSPDAEHDRTPVPRPTSAKAG